MNTRLSALALSAVLVAGLGISPIFAQLTTPISVSTSMPVYGAGETVVVTGEVRELLSGYPVSIQVFAPNGNLVNVNQINVEPDRTFTAEISTGAGWKEGSYMIKVVYGGDARSAETTFELGASGIITPSTPSGLTQRVEGTDFSLSYTITGGSIVSITPDVDAASLIIEIDSTDDGVLTITLPRALIEADNGFLVLVDGTQVEFDESETATDSTLTIAFPNGAETIEIIGTMVVPEFGTIAVLVLAAAIVSIIAVSARSRLGIMRTY
ncbi:hypothetical protein CENSYa_1569 [Cenarchaeum symbiosum A]|uniref:PEFG-CTERM sorting domain-containing protein n=1 Tax=Cenarchaeum symbiosum (strain A) TaxID=414004 RepID=A0RXX2_CENSY|nr:hypothetical protein CENSYa_1569 [Cenarchaeum symbiosum A]